MPTSFYSNGKLLLTGEYAILDGAKGLALPTKFGQYLSLTHSDSENFIWNSLDENDAVWFSSEFSKNRLETIHTSDPEVAHRLSQILVAAKKLNPLFSPTTDEVNDVETKVTFPRDWGLGTSSTLIYLLAKWADVDPFQLQFATFGGSGYDIACAGAAGPILYKKENGAASFEPCVFAPPFVSQLYFVFLGKKQNSREGIQQYRTETKKGKAAGRVAEISDLTGQFLKENTLTGFEKLIVEHEELVGSVIGALRAKTLYFNDYWGQIKSLGAWGGDFVLATSDRPPEETRRYFNEKGFGVFIPYKDMALI